MCKKLFTFLAMLIHYNFIQAQSLTIENINNLYMERLMLNLNTSVDPCENFYEYACGNWSTNYPLTSEYVDMPGYIDYKVNKQLLEALKQHKSDTGIYEKLWQYYNSCQELNRPALNNFLQALEAELQMQWPIFRANWSASWQNESNFDWLHTVGVLRKYGLNGVFITQDINVKITNGSHYLLSLQKHQATKNVLVENEIVAIFIEFGLTEEESLNISENIMQLERAMRNFTMDNMTNMIVQNNVYPLNINELTLKELSIQITQFDWQRYLNLVLERDLDLNALVQIQQIDVDYFQNLNKLFRDTTNETICYYIMLKLMYSLNVELPIVNNSTISSKTNICIAQLRGNMALAMNYLYEEHYYKHIRRTTDAALLNIYHRLRRNFEHLLRENNLNLTKLEIDYLKEELYTMRLKIGNIPEQLNLEFVENFYASLHFNSSDFYGNKLQLLHFNTQRNQMKLLNLIVPDGLHFYEHDATTASSSSPVKIFDNAILLPYGYLQMPVFDEQLDELYQYSLLGFIIGHEIVHAFDLFHIVFDANGNYNETGFAIAQHFREFMNCYVQSETDLLSETMADVSGLRLVYDTYFNDVFINSSNELPYRQNNIGDISYTNEQLFFLNSVQFLCANMLKITDLNLDDIDLGHDMHNKRVIRNWANFEAFALAFQCSDDAQMNPERRCRLW